MKVILFGATGMVGQGVLRECLLDPAVTRVLAVTRGPTGQRHEKLRELVLADVSDLAPVAGELGGYDACFYCLGVSSVGMSEADYTRVTYDLTLNVARVLIERNPGMTFLFISGGSTDSSEQGRVMWARVKGKTENALRAMPWKASFMLRPGYIQPLHGIVSKTRFLRVLYAVFGPLYPLLKWLFPRYVTTTETLGRAMILIARQGAPHAVLENHDINAVVAAGLSAPAAR
jgi:uncharacterized protein YbjT (DUF2867 family)